MSIIDLMSKLHRGWFPNPPSQRFMIKVCNKSVSNCDAIVYEWIQRKAKEANVVNVLLVKIRNNVYL